MLYALGGAGGGLTCYIDDGFLCCEYNTFIVMRTTIRSESKLPEGRAKIQIDTPYAEARPAGPLDITITITVNGDAFGSGRIRVSVPVTFSANDCLDIGTCLGSPVSLAYYDRVPFPVNDTIRNVNVLADAVAWAARTLPSATPPSRSRALLHRGALNGAGGTRLKAPLRRASVSTSSRRPGSGRGRTCR